MCAPREGYLHVVYKIFRYLQNNLKRNSGRIAFDPKVEYENELLFLTENKKMVDIYSNASEAIPMEFYDLNQVRVRSH